MHLCLHSASKRRKNYNDLKCCGGESCTFPSLRNHPEATQSKIANFIFDSNWSIKKPKPENAWEVFWCVTRRRQMERGCPWRPSFSEGSYIPQCHLCVTHTFCVMESKVPGTQIRVGIKNPWILPLSSSFLLPLALSLLSLSFSLSSSLSLFTQCLSVGLCMCCHLLQQEVPLVADEQGTDLWV